MDIIGYIAFGLLLICGIIGLIDGNKQMEKELKEIKQNLYL